jgi:hypothetical protein
MVCAILSLVCNSKISEADQFKQQKFILYEFWSYKSTFEARKFVIPGW